jgi:hypothetical protein
MLDMAGEVVVPRKRLLAVVRVDGACKGTQACVRASVLLQPAGPRKSLRARWEADTLVNLGASVVAVRGWRARSRGCRGIGLGERWCERGEAWAWALLGSIGRVEGSAFGWERVVWCFHRHF